MPNESSVERYRRHIAEARERDRIAYDRIMQDARCNPATVLYCGICGIGTTEARDEQRKSFTR